MRIATVVGVILAGGIIGAAAVLAPLSLGASRPSGNSSGWMAGIGDHAAGLVRAVALTFTSSSPSPSPSDSRSQSDGERVAVPAVAAASDGSGSASADGSKAGATVAGTAGVAGGAPKRIAVALENGVARKLTSSKPVGDEARIDLVRDIQRELKRVGCYDGDVDGSWGTASKRAIATFTERVNASLAIDEPDFILLTLLQGHSGQACGATCPAGQSAATGSTGRCVPNSVLAQTNKPAKDRERVNQQRDQQAALRAAGSQPPATTTSETKVNQMAAVPAGVVATGSAWTTKVITEPSAPAKAIEGTKSAVASLDGGVASSIAPQAVVAPLPGRMAIGAPIPAATSLPAEQAIAATPVVPGGPVVERKAPASKRVAAIHKADDTAGDDDDAEQAQSKETPKLKAAAAPRPLKAQPPNAEASRGKTTVRALDQPEPVAKFVRRPQQVVIVQRPPPVRYQAPSYVRGPSWTDNSKSGRQRRMVYDLFQRPDRN
jgi:hypothetical protein